MKQNGWLNNLSQTLFSHVIKLKKQKAIQVALPSIYTGTWRFTDELSKRKHYLEITPDLHILIDHRELAGQVQILTEKELVFLDGYGYQLRIDAVDGQPISVYDEADNRVYELEHT